MKNYLFSIALLIASIGVSAQNSIILKGTVTLKDPEVEVLENNKTIATIPVKEDGTFYGVVPLDRFKQIQCRHGVAGQPLYAKPGREVTIHFGPKPMTTTFTGSPETELYIDMRFLLYPGDVRIIWDMPWHVYKKYQEDAWASKKKYCEIFYKAYPDIPESFIEELRCFHKYSNYYSLAFWRTQVKKPLTEAEDADHKAYIKSLGDSLTWDDPRLCNVSHYVQFAEHVLNQELEGSDGVFLLNVYDLLQKKISNTLVREYFILDYTKKYLKDLPNDMLEKVITAFKQQVSNPRYLAQTETIIQEAKRLSTNAGEAYDFTLEDVNGKQITLSKFKGKVVYLDFWATWCAPCRGEIPPMNKLKEELKGNDNIVIICVSVDQEKDKEKWKAMVKEQKMGDYQVFAGTKASDIQKAYGVRGIPHFTMIGKDGKIYKNMTIRPSNPQTRSVLLDLTTK